MLIFATKIAHIDQAIIDPWTAIHASSGLLLGLLGTCQASTLAIATLWEIIENLPTGRTIWLLMGDDHYNGDSWQNIISDILFVTLFSRVNKDFNQKTAHICLIFLFLIFRSYDAHLAMSQCNPTE